MATETDVLRFAEANRVEIASLLGRYTLELATVPAGESIRGSYWGDEEAGLVGHRLLVRQDTPVHSILHEAGHFVCMHPVRRRRVDTDAGGDYAEENAVCYLQILLAGNLTCMGMERMFRDMDAWGYSFRLGSAQAWFERDSEDAVAWLRRYAIIDKEDRPRWRLRGV